MAEEMKAWELINARIPNRLLIGLKDSHERNIIIITTNNENKRNVNILKISQVNKTEGYINFFIKPNYFLEDSELEVVDWYICSTINCSDQFAPFKSTTSPRSFTSLIAMR